MPAKWDANSDRQLLLAIVEAHPGLKITDDIAKILSARLGEEITVMAIRSRLNRMKPLADTASISSSPAGTPVKRAGRTAAGTPKKGRTGSKAPAKVPAKPQSEDDMEGGEAAQGEHPDC